MQTVIKDKPIIIVGGSRGIGQAIGRCVLKAGVVAVFLRAGSRTFRQRPLGVALP